MLQKKKPITEQEALQKLSALCARAEHSSGEMLEKMRRWQLSEDARERVFARLFVREKIRFDRWGRRKIEQALYQKGVASDISRRVLNEVDDEAYMAELKKLIAAKRRSVQAESDYEMRAKLTKYALGRGFDYNVIRQCIDGADELLDQ